MGSLCCLRRVRLCLSLSVVRLCMSLYQDFNTADSYKGTCAKSEADFQLVFGGDSEASDDDEEMETDLLKEEIEDKDFRQNDPVQKQHFQRNEVLAMTNK